MRRGDLVLSIGKSELRFLKPVIYQESSGARQSVRGKFVLRSAREVGFQLASYDSSRPVVIDPVLSYSTYLGGTGNDAGLGIAVDFAGNAYVTGQTDSINFPTVSPIQPGFGGGPAAASYAFSGDAFVTKFNAGGSLVYSTYLGGSGGDAGYSIAVDSAGNAYVTGRTTSTNFPTTPGAFQRVYGGGNTGVAQGGDAFVAKLNSAGSALVYSTYLGGASDDWGSGIAVDSAGMPTSPVTPARTTSLGRSPSPRFGPGL